MGISGTGLDYRLTRLRLWGSDRRHRLLPAGEAVSETRRTGIANRRETPQFFRCLVLRRFTIDPNLFDLILQFRLAVTQYKYPGSPDEEGLAWS